MSKDAGIPFEISHPQQNFRFLELPPSLLESITSNHPPHLSLKSAAPSDDVTPGSANAVLCTDTQTFAVRQVNSSNSVFVVRPSEHEGQLEDNAVPNVHLSAIAQCTTTLELIPTSLSATALLRRGMLVYEGVGSALESEMAERMGRKGKDKLLEDLPLSRGEFEDAWRGMCAFEFLGQACEPTAAALGEIWKCMMSAAVLRGINLEEGFSVVDLAGPVEEDGHPSALLRAVLRRHSPSDAELSEEHACLSREASVLWIGTVLLESLSLRNKGVSQDTFLQEWRDQLLESWRKDASMDLLKGKYSQTSEGYIIYSQGTSDGSSTAKPSATTVGKASRKWHEKFKNTKR